MPSDNHTGYTNSAYLVVDTETTGIDPAEHRAVEVAAVMVKAGQITCAFTTYLNPNRVIPAQASAVHGLVDEDVKDAPTLEATLPWLNALACKVDAIVAHNAPFDRAMLPGLVDKPWLDTLRLSRKLYPELDGHSNQVMRFHLNLRAPEANGMPAHRALADAYVTARLLTHLLGEVESRHQSDNTMPGDLFDLLKWSDEPNLLTTCTFGKHRGTPWAQVPIDYLQWLRRSDGWESSDPDQKFTVMHYLMGR